MRQSIILSVFRILTFFCITLLSAHASAKSQKMYQYGKALKKLGPVSSVAVLPLNANTYLKPEEAKVLKDSFLQALSALEYQARYLPITDQKASELYFQATTDLRGNNSADVQNFKSQLVSTFNISQDVVFLLSVEQRIAELKGSAARWDGVSHPVILEKASIGDDNWSGNISGLSIKIDAYSSKGDYLFTSYGAVSIPKYATMDHYSWHRKEHVFEKRKDQKMMKQGIAKALKPMRKKVKLAKK